MTRIGASVGERGVNRPADVAVIQGLLNHRIATFQMAPIAQDGRCGDDTVRAIRNFQVRALRDLRASGMIEPNDRTWAALESVDPGSLMLQEGRTKAARRMLSGQYWFRTNEARFADSRKLSDLAPGFQIRASEFVDALRRAGAEVNILATRRNAVRAWLMEQCFKVAEGSTLPENVADMPEAGIIWNHGDRRDSRRAAREMVEQFGLRQEPAVTQPAIQGLALDMVVGWSQPIRMLDAGGKPHILDRPRDGARSEALHAIAAGFGLAKHFSDPLQWTAKSF